MNAKWTYFYRWFREYPCKYIGFVMSLFAMAILWVLYPIVKIKVGGLITPRIGHLALNTDLFFRTRQLEAKKEDVKYIFLAGALANKQLFLMWKREFKSIGAIVIQNRFLRQFFEFSKWMWRKTRFFEPIDEMMNSNEYDIYSKTYPVLSFTPEEEAKGRDFLSRMGLDPNKDWFVCVYARDPSYMKIIHETKFLGTKDYSYHDFRNANIDTYIPAIDYIIKNGGYVFRMGFHVSKHVNYKHERFIDYAIEHRSDFMDIYLGAKCRFYIATCSGISDVALIFNRPLLGVNDVPFGWRSYGKYDLSLPKLIKERRTGKYFSYAAFAKMTENKHHPLMWNGHRFRASGFEYEDNSDEDILEATVEMVDRLNGTFVESVDDKRLQELYLGVFSRDHWAHQIKTPMSRDFLRKYQYLFKEQINV